MSKERTTGVESARRVVNILLMFSESTPEVNVEDVMNIHNISQASAYRYLSLLREIGLLKLRGPGAYVLTARVQQLAAAFEQAVDLETLALPTMRRLTEATQETAFIMKRVRDEAIFVAQTEPDRAMALSFRPGATSPLHRGAVAKVLLAFSSEAHQQAYVTGRIYDSVDQQRILDEMVQIRDRGYAESESEVDEGIWGGAVPVISDGELVASLSIAGPAFRLSMETRTDIVERLRNGADEISRLYGSSQDDGGVRHSLVAGTTLNNH